MLKNIKWTAILISLVYTVLGLFMIMFPAKIANMICLIFGITLIVYGIIDIITYFTMELRVSLFRNDFYHGVLVVLFGVLVITQRNLFQSIIPFVLGILLVSSGFAKIQDGIDARRISAGWRWSTIILAVISIVFGLIAIFNPMKTQEALFRIIGIGLMYSGLTDLYYQMYLSGKIRKWTKEVEEAQARAEGPVVEAEFDDHTSEN